MTEFSRNFTDTLCNVPRFLHTSFVEHILDKFQNHVNGSFFNLFFTRLIFETLFHLFVEKHSTRTNDTNIIHAVRNSNMGEHRVNSSQLGLNLKLSGNSSNWILFLKKELLNWLVLLSIFRSKRIKITFTFFIFDNTR